MAELLSETFTMPHPQDHSNNPKILPILLKHSLFHFRLITTAPYSSAPLYHTTPSPDHGRLWLQPLGWPETRCATVSAQYEKLMTSCSVFVARQSWFQSQLLLCSWMITPSKIWTINPAVITVNMYWDSLQRCTVKWTSVWLHVLKENKSLSFAHFICYLSFICSHDFVRQLCVATLVNTKLLREVQYSYLPLGTEAQKKIWS